MLVSYIELDKVESINDIILANDLFSKQLGASMSRLFKRDDGYGEVRIVFNQDNSEAGIGIGIVIGLSASTQ